PVLLPPHAARTTETATMDRDAESFRMRAHHHTVEVMIKSIRSRLRNVDASHSCRDSLSSQRIYPALYEGKHALDDQSQSHHDDGAGKKLALVVRGQTVSDEPSESTGADECCDRRRCHDLHSGDANAGHDEGHPQRQLDPTEQLPAGHAHATRGVASFGIDLAQADI